MTDFFSLARYRASTKASGAAARKSRKKPEHRESKIQISLMDHVRARLVRGCVPFAIGNGGRRGRVEAGIMKAEGVLAGMPDLGFIYRGAIYFIELKAPATAKSRKGGLSKVQRDRIVELKAAGAIVAVCTGLDAAIRQLEIWGLLRGRAQLQGVAA